MPNQPTFENTGFVSTLLQAGTSVSSTWTEGTFTSAGSISPNITWSDTSNIGFTYDFGVELHSTTGAFETERALNQAPTVPYTDVNSDLAGTSEVDRPWTLTLVTGFSTFRAFSLYVTSESVPAIFDSSGQLAETSASPSPYLVETFTNTSSVWTTGIIVGSVVTIPIDFAPTLSPVSGTAVPNAINRLIRDPFWNGRLQFFLTLDETASAAVAATAFTGQVLPFHTGQMGLNVKRRARVVHDYIEGFPYLSDEAVEDPFREGVMVHWSSADPVELRRHFTYVPPASEGVVEDDIPNVE